MFDHMILTNATECLAEQKNFPYSSDRPGIQCIKLISALSCTQIRTGPGAKGLLLCHADAVPASDSPDSQPLVTLTRLSEELKSGPAPLQQHYLVVPDLTITSS